VSPGSDEGLTRNTRACQSPDTSRRFHAHLEQEPPVRLLESLAKLCANLVGATIVGDFELSGAAAGAAIALFMPWCQFQRGNIIVDFFTARASARTTEALDRFGALLLGLAMALLS